MSSINYKEIYDVNKDDWKALTREPQKYEALLAGHYSDSNHFVYELLQNAEDEKATKTVIEYYEDKLIFYHDGEPFNRADVLGVSSMLMGTKNREDAQTIGRFGMGFKSVFKYTCQPEIYSDDEAFRIESYLLPVEIEGGWDYEAEKHEISYKSSKKKPVHPFAGAKHLTKIIIPFFKKDKNGKIEKIQGQDVLIKLRELSGETLLFLSNIKSLCWIDKTTDEGAVISLKQDKKDRHLIKCGIRKINEKKERTSNYLKFRKVFNHPNMKSAEVSVAYKLNNRADNINEMEGTDICVYFPTKDETKLPFLIHGSFETAVSREKLMTPSPFNDYLFDVLGDLIANSMNHLKDRKLITQNFIRHVLLKAFEDKTIPEFREKVTEVFCDNAMIPDMDGNYHKRDELLIPMPFGIADFRNKPFFNISLADKTFAALNDEKGLNFREYCLWLSKDLHIKVYSLLDWARDLKNTPSDTEFNIADFERFYGFLNNYKEENTPNGYRHYLSSYGYIANENFESAWETLREAPVIVSSANTLSAAYDGTEQLIYLGSSSEYKKVSSIVHHDIANKFSDLLTENFKLTEFDDFQYIKEKVLKRYAVENISFGYDEYAQDLRQIIKLLENPSRANEMTELLKKAYIIKVSEAEEDVFAKPQNSYADLSDEGIDMRIYFAPLSDGSYDKADDDYCANTNDFDMYYIDKAFYEKYNISVDKLKKLGLCVSPVTDGGQSGKNGNKMWMATGKYHPKLEVYGGEKNLRFIKNNPQKELSKKKSAQILKLLLFHADKLSGKVQYGKTYPRIEDEETEILRIAKEYKWLYGRDGKMYAPEEISKYDLDMSVYGEVTGDKEAYKILGFIEKEQDAAETAFEIVEKLDEKNKKVLVKQLARQLGWSIAEIDETGKDIQYTDKDTTEEDRIFNINDWQSNDFPVHKVRDMDSLTEHVKRQFYCADPIKYEKVLRQIRTSKSLQIRAYALNMYTNDSNVKVCQMCKNTTYNPEIVEISNYGLELPLMHLCFCRNCAAEYKQMRDSNKENFKKEIHNQICEQDISSDADEYKIILSSDKSVYFTQAHIAELQTLFELIDEYGVPDMDNKNL